MTKGDLRTGMMVVTKAGKIGMVLIGIAGGNIIIFNSDWVGFASYASDLICPHSSQWNIDKVIQPAVGGHYRPKQWGSGRMLWERPVPLVMVNIGGKNYSEDYIAGLIDKQDRSMACTACGEKKPVNEFATPDECKNCVEKGGK